MDKDRCNAGLLEPRLETPQNSFGSFEVVSIGLQIPSASHQPLVGHKDPEQSISNSRSEERYQIQKPTFPNPQHRQEIQEQS